MENYYHLLLVHAYQVHIFEIVRLGSVHTETVANLHPQRTIHIIIIIIICNQAFICQS